MRLFLLTICAAVPIFLSPLADADKNTGSNTPSDKFFLVYLKDHFGYIDNNGKIIFELPPEMGQARNFREGLAVTENIKNNFFLIYEPSGNVKFKSTFSLIFDYSEGLSRVRTHQDKWGFIDQNGDLAIGLEYDHAEHFSEGLALVIKNGENFFINQKGETVLGPLDFDEIGNFSNEMATVKSDNKFGFINKQGALIVPPQFDDARPFSEGLASVKVKHKYGFINTAGQFAIDPQFIMAFDFHEGLAAVIKDGKWGYLKHDGTFAIAPQFRNASDFSDGLAAVLMENDKWGYINTDGKTVIEPQFDFFAGNFSNGLAQVINLEEEDPFSGYINKQGEVVFKNQE